MSKEIAPGSLAAIGKQLPDGGWSYYSGHAARLEPTCWALLAFASRKNVQQSVVDRARSFLAGCQREDGLLVEPESGVVNIGWNGLAVLAAFSSGPLDKAAWVDRVVAALLRSKGIQVEASRANASQNNGLQAWSWIDGTFSWIEPTAYCLLALKCIRARGGGADARVADAEAMIVNRVCESGGWNYGNAQMFEQDLRPYVSTTALALLAMQDKQHEPAVIKSLDWLTAHALAERSAMALSLAAICLTVYGRPVAEILAALAADYQRTGFLGNTHLAAMALYASSLPEHRARAFTI